MSKVERVSFGKLGTGERPSPADRLDALNEVAKAARATVRTGSLEKLAAALAELDTIEAGCRGA